MLNWIQTIWDYNYWGHHKILDCLDTISEADFKRDVDYSIGSLHQQIVHVMWAEDVWYARLHDMPRPTYIVDDYPTRNSIREKWTITEINWREYLQNLTETELSREFEMTRLNGQALIHSVMEIML
ncbi:MAG: DinB family protein, partial [Aggregatilineales bacterium]